MFEPKSEGIMRKASAYILALLLVAEITLAACGGVIRDSRPDAPSPVLEPTHRVALYQRFCGLFLNRIETTPETGTTVTHHRLSYNIGDDLRENFAVEGGQIPTVECGDITFTGPAPYMDGSNNLQAGGAGFVLPPHVTQGESAQN